MARLVRRALHTSRRARRRRTAPQGSVEQKEVFPGRDLNNSPAPGSYAPANNTIGSVAAAVIRQAQKLQQLRQSRKEGQPDRFKSEKQDESPGPGSYAAWRGATHAHAYRTASGLYLETSALSERGFLSRRTCSRR